MPIALSTAMGIRAAYASGVSDMRWRQITRGWITLVITLTLLLLLSSPVHAFSELNDNELSEVYAEGYSSFTLDIETGVAKALWNIEARTFTEIDSLKMGYYDNSVARDGSGFGWDEDWTAVSLGSATEDLVCKGLFIEAKFTDITNLTGNRTLDYIKVGTPSMTGPITASFNSFSGSISGTDYHRQNLGLQTIYSHGGEFSIQITATGANAGWWFSWSNATITATP